jgi:glucokinase
MREVLLGLDIGGTKLAVGVGTAAGELLGDAHSSTPQRPRPQEVVESLVELAELALRKAGAIWKEVKGVGISFGGPVDLERGHTIACHHLPGWNNVPLVKVVQTRFHLPTVMDNDANLGALGEARFGAGRKVPDLLYMTISTGIGGGLVLGGELYRGYAGISGEVGHTILRPGGPLCTCGRKGCLEALASGWSIAKQAQELLAASKLKSLLRDVKAEELDAKAVAEAAGKKDKLALEVMGEAIDALGQGIAGAINLLNLPLVILGGGVAKAGNVLFVPLREAVARYALPESWEASKVVPAELGDNAPLLGAIALAANGAIK